MASTETRDPDPLDDPAEARTGTPALATVTRWTVLAMGFVFVVILGSGLYLIWNYRPTESLGWVNVQQLDGPDTSLPETMRTVHQLSSRILLVLAVLTAVMLVVLAIQRRRVGAGLTGGGVFVAVLAASFTGSLLAWDQVALWAVTVGNDFRGYAKILAGDKVRYVLVGHGEISVDTFRRWFAVHTAAVPIVLLALGAIAWRAARRPATGG